MACFVHSISEFWPTVTIQVAPTFTLRGVERAVASWSVNWGDGTSASVPTSAPLWMDHGYVAGTGFYAGNMSRVAEGGEVLSIRVDFSMFNLTTDGVARQGGRFTDYMTGGSGADTLDGGVGNDVMWGRAGDDLLLGGGGNDLLYAGTGDSTLSDGAGADTLVGGAGADTLFAGTGDDRLIGGNGNDWLGHAEPWSCYPSPNGSGSDLLNGGDGADTLVGSGRGSASLQLGKDDEADLVLFGFSSSYATDSPDGIANFDPSRDRIQFGHYPNQNVELVIGTNPVAIGDRWALLYDTDTGRLFVDAPDGLVGSYPPINTQPVHLATLWHMPALTAENFIL